MQNQLHPLGQNCLCRLTHQRKVSKNKIPLQNSYTELDNTHLTQLASSLQSNLLHYKVKFPDTLLQDSSVAVYKIKLSNQVERWFTIQDPFHFHLPYRDVPCALRNIDLCLASRYKVPWKMLERYGSMCLQFFFSFSGFISSLRTCLQYAAFYPH